MPEINCVYDVAGLRRRYGISRQEAARLLRRFGNEKAEVDHLLAASGRTPRHRRGEIATPEEDAAFGIG